MLLTLDVGNSEITAGLFRGATLVARWRLTTDIKRTPDEWAVTLESFIIRAGHSPGEIAACVVASVVPGVSQSMLPALHQSICSRVLVVDPRTELPIRLDVDEPFAVGADRIATALGAATLYPGDCIVVACGTATTFNCITADRRFIGGSIMPGLRTSADQLIRRAAKLTATDLLPPTRAIGRTTDDNIRAGVLFGAADAIDGMIRRIFAEWPTAGSQPRVVGTGGLAALIAPLSKTLNLVDPDLTLHGLRVAAAAMGVGS
jgi:type III pantothenate kinase